MAADADPGLVDVAVRLAVGRLDDLEDVDAGPVGVVGEFVGQRDVDVSIGRLGQLGELGGLGAAHGHDLGIEHRGIEGGRAGRRRRPDPADQLRIGREVPEDVTGQQPLRGKRDEQVVLDRQAAGRLERRREATPRVADRQRRLEDDQRAWVQAGPDGRGGRVHVAVVRLLAIVQHDRNDDHDHDSTARAAAVPSVVARSRPGGVGLGDRLDQSGFLGHVRAALR